MALSPVKPSDFQAILPQSEDSICTLLVKFMKLTVLWWRWQNYAFDEDGAFTSEYRAQICAAQQSCP